MELQDMKVILHTASLDLYSACSACSRVVRVGELRPPGARSPLLRHPGAPGHTHCPEVALPRQGVG